MKVLLFEWLTGGGLWSDAGGVESASQLLEQGVAMVSAVGKDLAEITQVDLDLLVDSRLVYSHTLGSGPIAKAAANLGGLIELVRVHPVDSHAAIKAKLRSLAARADAILLIAPETDDCLADSIRWVGEYPNKLISPTLDFVVATSNKNLLADLLMKQGFEHIPPGMDLESFLSLSATQQAAWFPMVVKPTDGAGSEGVEYFDDSAGFNIWRTQNDAGRFADFRAEQFVVGTPASIAVICRPDGEPTFFPALKQILHPPPVGEYLRSEDCLSPSQQLRAKRLAANAINCLPITTGFFGLDIVLGDEQDDRANARDVLIEINPRITMSYLTLSQRLGRGQIAKMMLPGPIVD